jgi:hypothetical protein
MAGQQTAAEEQQQQQQLVPAPAGVQSAVIRCGSKRPPAASKEPEQPAKMSRRI